MRSEFGPDGQSCPGCPPDEKRIADLMVGEARLVGTGDANVFGYQDTETQPGDTLPLSCDWLRPTGFCGEASAPAELSLPTMRSDRRGADSEPIRKDPQESKKFRKSNRR